MISKSRVIASIVVFVLFFLVLFTAFDYFFPHEGVFLHMLHAAMVVVPATILYGLIVMRALGKRRQAEAETHLLLTLTQAISESQDFYATLEVALSKLCEATAWNYGEVWIPSHDASVLECAPVWYSSSPEKLQKFRQVSEKFTFQPNVGLPGRVWSSKKPEWIPDVSISPGNFFPRVKFVKETGLSEELTFPPDVGLPERVWSSKKPEWIPDASISPENFFLRDRLAKETGLKAGFGVPITTNGQVLAVLIFFMFKSREEDNRLVKLVSTVAMQLGSVIQRKQAEELSRDLFTSSTVGTFISQDGKFQLVNPQFQKFTGYSEDELLEADSLDGVFPEDRDMVRKNAVKMLKGKRSSPYEYRYIKKNGEVRWVMETVASIQYQGRRAALGNFVDITERKQAEETLRNIAQGVSAATGEAFFQSLVQHLAKALSLEYAFVGELEAAKKESIKTVAVSAHGKIVDNFEYQLANTPCQNIVGKHPRSYPHGVQQQFSKDHLLVEMGVESYAGIPLFDSAGGALGLLVVMDSKPMSQTDTAESMLRIFAVRASAEMERQRAEELSRDLFTSSTVGTFITQDGKFQLINPRFQELTGYSEDELLGVDSLDNVFPEDMDVARENAVKMLKGKRSSPYEYRYIKKNGEVIWVMGTVTSIQYQGRRAALGNFMDITERKQAEEQILRQGSVLEAINRVFRETLACETEAEVARICHAVAVELTDSKFGWIGEVNQAGRFDAIALSDPGWDACRIPESKAVVLIKDMEIRGIWGRVLKDEKSLIVNDPSSHPDRVGTPKGHPPLTSFLGVPLKHAGRTIGMIALANKESGYDLADQQAVEALSVVFVEALRRKRAEEQLRAAEQNFRNSLDSSPLGIRIVSAEGELLYANQAILDIYGYSNVKELKAVLTIQRYTPESYAEYQERKEKRQLGKPVPACYEVSIIRKDGEVRRLEVFRREVIWDGKTQFQALYWDITDHKQAEEREKQLQAELYLSSRLASIGELAAGVAHEINNPLTGIMGFSQLLLRKSTDEKTRQDLERIYDGALRAAKIVENLLTFARNRQPKRQYAGINDVLQKALELRAYELKTSNIEVVTDLTSSLPYTMVDFYQIQEVFLNIIMNAEQVMTEVNRGGKLTIKTQKAKGYIRVSFTDDGPGISAEHLNKIFDPFFTTRGEKGGTGLGLSVCHGIVTEHGGRIYARSQPGKGATFVVELPVTEEVDRSKVVEEQPVRSGK